MNFNKFWGISLIACPLVFRATRGGLREGKDIFFWLVVMISSMLFINPVRKLPLFETVCFACLMVYSFLNVDNFATPGNYYHIIFIGTGLLFLKNFYENFNNFNLDIIYNCIFGLAVILITWVVLNKFGISPNEWIADLMGLKTQMSGDQTYPRGPLNNPSLSGALLAFCAPVFFIKRFNIYLPLLIIGLYYYNSSMAYLSVIGSASYFFYYAVLYKKSSFSFLVDPKTLPLAMALAVLAGAYIFTGPNGVDGIDSQRFLAWTVILTETDLGTFFFGNGTGWFYDHFSQMYTISKVRWYQEHNEFLASYIAFGAMGFILFCAMFSRAIKRSNNAIASAGLFGVFINCYGNFTLHISSLFLIGGIYYCICLSGIKQKGHV